MTQLCATKWRTGLGLLRKYIIKKKGIQLHRSRSCKDSPLKSEIVETASTGLLSSRNRYDYKHIQGGVGLNYGDCEMWEAESEYNEIILRIIRYLLGMY